MGRWNGLHVRIHMFFLLFAALTLYLSWMDSQALTSDGNTWVGVACVAILGVSVLIHELAHVVVANRYGHGVREIVLGPTGGLGPTPDDMEPQCELLASTAGPLANLGVCLIAAFSLALHDDVRILGLLNPFSPTEILVGSPLIVGLKLTFWINWFLLLVNLLPAFPFDGGRALRCMIVLTNTAPDEIRAVFLVARLARVAAVGLLVAAWLTLGVNATYPFQIWFALVLLAIFVYFSARREEVMAQNSNREDAFLGYDFSAGYTSLEGSSSVAELEPPPAANDGPLSRWWHQRRAERDRRQREVEMLEDGRVDDILLKVHRTGIESLSPEDRALLDRASRRYRSRARDQETLES